jgi:hypothetical protein
MIDQDGATNDSGALVASHRADDPVGSPTDMSDRAWHLWLTLLKKSPMIIGNVALRDIVWFWCQFGSVIVPVKSFRISCAEITFGFSNRIASDRFSGEGW